MPAHRGLRHWTVPLLWRDELAVAGGVLVAIATSLTSMKHPSARPSRAPLRSMGCPKCVEGSARPCQLEEVPRVHWLRFLLVSGALRYRVKDCVTVSFILQQPLRRMQGFGSRHARCLALAVQCRDP
jgi:hypothetical protein